MNKIETTIALLTVGGFVALSAYVFCVLAGTAAILMTILS